MQTLSLLIKPASGNCNMRCRYCFYASVSDSRKIKNNGFMTVATLETLVKRAFDECDGFCSFGFQGGEPTLIGIDFYRHLIGFQKKYNKKNIAVANSVQTNGLAIDREWASFWAEHGFLVGLSIDCHQEIHDRFRRDTEDEGTFGRCLEAARTLAEHGVDFNILCVVTRQIAERPYEVYDFLKRHGFRYAQFIPCLDDLDEVRGGNPYSLEADVFGGFLKGLFDRWHEDFLKGDYYSIRFFDNSIRLLMGEPPEHCAAVGSCRGYPLIEADGTVYPCDFYAQDRYAIGHVETDSYARMLGGAACVLFAKESGLVHPDCPECRFNFICRSGCRRDREPFAEGGPSLNYHCEAYRAFFEYALPRMLPIASKLSGKI